MSLEYYQSTLDDSKEELEQLIRYHQRLEKLKELNKKKENKKPTLDEILKRHGFAPRRLMSWKVWMGLADMI